MTKQEAINFFGGVKKLAHALGVWPQTIYDWRGEIPSMKNQIKIANLSGHKLKITPIPKRKKK